MRKEGLRRNGRLAGFEVQYLAAFTGYSPQACVALAPRWCADRSPLPRDATAGRSRPGARDTRELSLRGRRDGERVGPRGREQ